MADHVHFRQYNKTYRIDFIRKLVSNLKAQVWVCQVNCVLDFSYATLGNLSAYLT